MVKTVILGTAHLKSTPGKCSPDKSLREYEYSRMICKRIKETLDKMGIDCIIDYEADDMPNTTPSQELVKRVKIVNDICKKKGSSNCMYVSIHLNAAGSGEWKNARGLSAYCYGKGSQKSKEMARTFYKEGALRGLKGNRSVPIEGYWTANFYVLKNTSCPAILTENLFQDNKEDVEFLKSEKGIQTIVDYHIAAIVKCLG